jgi:flagellar biosynthesis GTPase FlhF
LSDPKPLFPKNLVIPIPNNKGKNINNFKDAIDDSSDSSVNNNDTEDHNKTEQEKIEKEIDELTEQKKLNEEAEKERLKAEKEKKKAEKEAKAKEKLEQERNEAKKIKPRTALTKSKDKTKIGYHIDRKVARFIKDLSNDLYYDEDIQDSDASIVCEELLKVGMFFFKKYSHILNNITSGDQISEFILREFKKEFKQNK